MRRFRDNLLRAWGKILMKVNLGVTLTDSQRVTFNAATGEPKMASRKQVVSFLQDCLSGALDYEGEAPTKRPTKRPIKPSIEVSTSNARNREILFNTHNDPALEGKSKGYIVGWNKVKFRKQLYVR